MKKFLVFILAIVIVFSIVACGAGTVADGTAQNTKDTISVTNQLTTAQRTPTDIDYSLERYNLIRRAYWVNGQREKANTLVCEIEKPLGYIVLFSGNAVVGSFVVDGKVTSLNSYLSPDSEYYEVTSAGGGTVSIWERNEWLADVDGSYGENDSGIFFFTPNGNYIEWTGSYLYSDILFEIDAPVVRYKGVVE